MSLKTYRYLTKSIVSRFGDRKAAGFVSIIIDTNSGEIYFVPRDMEHIDFLCKILSVNKIHIQQNPSTALHLIPSIIEIKEENLSGFYRDSVAGVLTGFSGAESGYNIRHKKKDLESAHAIALKFVEDGDIVKNSEFKDQIVYRYAVK